MTAKPRKLSDQIRQAVANAGVTRYRISQETGLDQTQLSKFVRGQRGLSLEALDTLAEFLGLEVIMRTTNKGR